MARVPIAKVILHQISDGTCQSGDSRGAERVIALADRAVGAGIDLFQLREPALEARALVDLARAIARRCRGTATRFVVNDRVDVALAAAADGVHLKEESLHPLDVRRVVSGPFLIGLSVHNSSSAAGAEGADYLVAGAVWPTASKLPGHATLGLAGLRAIVEATRSPVLAIGGVTTERVEEIAACGAQGIAAIGLFQPRNDEKDGAMRDLAQDLRLRFDTRIGRSYH